MECCSIPEVQRADLFRNERRQPTAGLFILEFSKKRLIESVCLNFRQVLMSDSHLDEQLRFIFYVEQTVVEPLHGNPNEPTGPGGSLDCPGSALEYITT